MSAPAKYDLVDRRPDYATVYARCPTCQVVAACSDPTEVAGSAQGTGLGLQIEVTCAGGGHRYAVTDADVLARDATHTCYLPSCGATFPVPAAADEVVCPTCRLAQRPVPAIAGGERPPR